MTSRAISGVDRAAIGALAIADVGVGVFLVGVVSLLLSLPAAVAAISGRLPGLSDEGVLVNVAVMVFVTLEVVFLPAELGQKVGLAIFVFAAATATAGLYLRLFGVLRLPQIRGRHHDQ